MSDLHPIMLQLLQTLKFLSVYCFTSAHGLICTQIHIYLPENEHPANGLVRTVVKDSTDLDTTAFMDSDGHYNDNTVRKNINGNPANDGAWHMVRCPRSAGAKELHPCMQSGGACWASSGGASACWQLILTDSAGSPLCRTRCCKPQSQWIGHGYPGHSMKC